MWSSGQQRKYCLLRVKPAGEMGTPRVQRIRTRALGLIQHCSIDLSNRPHGNGSWQGRYQGYHFRCNLYRHELNNLRQVITCVITCDSPHLAYSSVEKTAMRGLEPRPPLSHHFRVTLCICFKTSLCKTFHIKMSLICVKMNILI